MAFSDPGESCSSVGLNHIPVSEGVNGRGFEKVSDMLVMFKQEQRVRSEKIIVLVLFYEWKLSKSLKEKELAKEEN